MRFVHWILLALPVFLIVGLFVTPWYTSRYAFWFQNLIGYSCWRLPEDYTGTVRYWDMRLRLTHSEQLVDGVQDGFTDTFDEHGRRIYHEQWKRGRPWNGICHFWADKAWVMEYRNGIIWNGAEKKHDPKTGTSSMVYHVEGQVVTEDVYRARHHVPDKAQCYGLGWF